MVCAEGMYPHNFAPRPPLEPRKLNTPGMNTEAFSQLSAWYGDLLHYILVLASVALLVVALVK